MKRIKIKDLKDLPDQMEINLDDGHAITIGRVRRGAPMKCSFPVLTDPVGDAPVQPVECGKPASVMMGDKWLCERHANIVLADD